MILMFLLLVFSSLTFGAAQPVFVVGTQDFEYSPQYDFTHSSDKGFAWSVLQLFAKEQGIKLEYKPLPLRRLQAELDLGHVDFVYPDNRRWHSGEEHELNRKFSAVISTAVYGTMVLAANVGRGRSNFKSVAFPRGFVPTKWYEILERRPLRIIETSNAELAIKMVLRNRADGTDIECSVSKFLLRKLGRSGALRIDRDLPFTEIGFRMSTIHQVDIIERLDDFLSTQGAALLELKRRYELDSECYRHGVSV